MNDQTIEGNVSTTTASSEQQQPATGMKQGKPKQETNGHITLKIDDFSAFAHQENGGKKWSDPVVIQGIEWRIRAYIHTNKNGAKYLRFKVCKDEKAPNCRALVKYHLISMKDGIENYVAIKACDFGTKGTHCDFGTKGKHCCRWTASCFKTIQEILDPANGWLENDTITLEAEVFANRPLEEAGKPRRDILIVNGHQINIDQHHLASHSSYFKSRFFDNGTWTDNSANGGSLKVEIDEEVSSVDDFELMIQCTYPDHPPLNDDCIEGVLNVANQFFIDRAEGICAQFLMEKSDKCAMFKYRMGQKYGLGALKELALMVLSTELPKSVEKLVEYTEELCKMNVQAQREFTELLAKRVQALAAKRN